MISKLLLVLSIHLALLALPGVVTVDYRLGGAGGHRIVVPVPTVLAQIALPFIPHEARELGLTPEFETLLPLAEGFSRALQSHPDVVLATMRSPHGRALLHKAGEDLRLDAGSAGSGIHCRLPLRSAERLLVACRDGTLTTSELARTLWSLPGGEYASFTSGGEEVRIGIWKL